jgi:hypothetical protein
MTMGFFGMLFWIVVIWLAVKAFRSYVGCAGASRSFDRSYHRRPLDDQQPYIDALESRVAELEERLDFTERLVAGRREAAS